MSYQEKNITVSLFSFLVILVVYLTGVSGMVREDGLDSTGLFRLWGVVIVLAIVFTIAATILTHILSAIIEVIRTGQENPRIEDFTDERDRLIDLRGTKITYGVSSIGVFLAMLTFVLGQPPLVMFALLILSGIVAQIAGDIARLVLYRRGF